MNCCKCEKPLNGTLDTFGPVGQETCFDCWCVTPTKDEKLEKLNQQIEETQEDLWEIQGDLEELEEDEFDNRREYEYEVEDLLYDLKRQRRSHIEHEKTALAQRLAKWNELAGVA